MPEKKYWSYYIGVAVIAFALGAGAMYLATDLPGTPVVNPSGGYIKQGAAVIGFSAGVKDQRPTIQVIGLSDVQKGGRLLGIALTDIDSAGGKGRVYFEEVK